MNHPQDLPRCLFRKFFANVLPLARRGDRPVAPTLTRGYHHSTHTLRQRGFWVFPETSMPLPKNSLGKALVTRRWYDIRCIGMTFVSAQSKMRVKIGVFVLCLWIMFSRNLTGNRYHSIKLRRLPSVLSGVVNSKYLHHLKLKVCSAPPMIWRRIT